MNKRRVFVLAMLAFGMALLSYGTIRASGPAAVPLPQAETPLPPQPPSPAVVLEKKVQAKPVNDVDNDGMVDAGDTIQYTITYSNTAPITATNVILIDNYDEGLVASVSNITGGGTDSGQAITWALGDLGSGQGNAVSYQATLRSTLPPGTTAVKNDAYISVGDLEIARNSQTTPIQRPDLTVAKAITEVVDVNLNEVTDVGDIVKYTIQYRNRGEAPATNVVIVDDYPEDFVTDIADISGSGYNDGKSITWNIGMLPTSDSMSSLSYKATLRGAFPPGLVLVENRVTISSAETQPVDAGAKVQVTVLTPTPATTPMPAPTPQPETTRSNLLEDSAKWLGPGIFILGVASLAALVWASTTKMIETCDEGIDRIRLLEEGVCIVLIAVSIVILRLTNCIREEGTVSILSGIIGYVLGRTVARGK